MLQGVFERQKGKYDQFARNLLYKRYFKPSVRCDSSPDAAPRHSNPPVSTTIPNAQQNHCARFSFVHSCVPCRKLQLGFSKQKAIKSVHSGGVTWLDLDPIEHRYLLAGAADGSVAAYDVQVIN